MRLKMTCTRRGEFGVFPIGQTFDLPDDLATEFLAQKAAVAAHDVQLPTVEIVSPRQERRRKHHEDPEVPAGPPTLEDAGLGGKVADLLRAGGLTTLDAVRDHVDLTELAGIGPATSASIRAALEKHDKAN